MGFQKRGAAGRARWLMLFAWLLGLCVALTVLVGPALDVSQATNQPSIDQGRIGLSDAVAVAGGAEETRAIEEGQPKEPGSEALPPDPSEAELQEAREEREREEVLSTPEAIAAREASRYAYTDLSPEQGEELLRQRFAPQLKQIDADPSRVLSEVTLEEVTSPTEALVTIEGEKALLESSLPLRAPDQGAGMAKVDLGLQESEGRFAPKNSLVDLSLPKSAADEIQVGEIGLRLATEKAATSVARPFGEEDLYLPEVTEDTSLLLSPITGGVEVSALVLSRKSPEQLGFEVTLPAGAELRPAPDGGAEVLEIETKAPLATIGAPHALDAQGTALPVSLSVEDNSVLLKFPHRSMDIAYPAFIDPEIEEHWEGFADTSKLNYWNWQWSGVPSSETYIGKRSCIVHCWGNGLYVRSRSNTNYPAGSYGRWWFVPQGSTTYMRRVIFGPMNMDAYGCWANQPHGYVGVWNGSEYVVHAPSYPSAVASWVDVGTLGPGARTAHVGISAAGAVNLNCGRDYAMGGAVLYLNDPEDPSVGTLSGYPSGWLKDNSPFTLNVPVSDPGLGVKSATVSPKDSPPLATKTLGCTGHYDSQCPANNTFQFPVSADSFSEGEKEVRVSATDAMTKTSNTQSFMMKVDRTPPDVTLAGQLANATDEAEGEKNDDTGVDALKLPVYNLAIEASDGSNASAATRRSGVKSIEVFLDEKATPEKTWTQPPCANSCAMTQTYTLKLNELEALEDHVLRILVTDHAGNTPRERNIEFEYVPATGMSEEHVLHYFPLPNGQGNEDEEEDPIRPELAVNVMNGNLVYRQLDVEVPGPAADLEVERYYNSLLPDSQDSEWGDGWTLAQTPTLEAEEPQAPGPPSEATLLEESGALESKVELPEETGEEVFDENLQAVVRKEATGYAITDESGESIGTLSFDEAGEATELQIGEYANVDYDYEEGELAEIAVDDPASFGGTPEEVAEQEELAHAPLYVESIGTQGTGEGQFQYPVGVALDPEGNVWAGDLDTTASTLRIQKFDPEGKYLDQITETGDGQRLHLSGLAVDSEGNVWTTDGSRSRVEVFDENGDFLRRFGSQGSGNGQLDGPEGIAIDPEGDVWVADKRNGRIQEFTAQGEFIQLAGSPGTEPGQLTRPNSIAIAPDGDVWVTDLEADRVSVFDQQGDFVRSFGSQGSGEGQFDQPGGIAIDAKGRVWIGDQLNDRVQQFDLKGEFVRQFGTEGSGEGEFQLCYPIGIATDDLGNIWITDYNNHRVQKWAIPGEEALMHVESIGTQGSGDGQFQYPVGVGVDPEGNIWAGDLDTTASTLRIQKFDPEGKYLDQITETGDGQRLHLSGLAVDSEGNVWTTDRSRSRVEVFDENGDFLRRFGSQGSGNGQLDSPEGIAIDPEGDVWVADKRNGRIQEFTAQGEFIQTAGSPGTEPGQLTRPNSIAIAPDGDVWVTDLQTDRVSVFDQQGDFVHRFGSQGSAEGQFDQPGGIAIDAKGRVWIGDQLNDRVQQFDLEGEFVRQFGTEGSGEGEFQLCYPIGIATDDLGNIWITDYNNHRVQWWHVWRREIPNPTTAVQDDPAVEVEAPNGLVDAVEGEEAGLHLYAHEGDLLTAHADAKGATEYEYDENDRMTKVTLPNGTYAEIAYEATYGRVESVTVALEGANPKTTYFDYEDQPQRRTTVTAPGVPVTTYEFGDDGSVLKWWNTKEPPKIDDIAGNLYDNRETAAPIEPGLYALEVQAFSAHGIASIEVIANNDTLVSEKSCPQIPGPPVECETETDEWVTETGSFAPGIVYIEVIATNSFGESTAERFWVNIPYTPPSNPEEDPAPTFSEIRDFRDAYGLDLDIDPKDEEALNDRVFNLLGDWNNPNTSSGEVARSTAERWGIPMRQSDAAELEYREWYVDVVGSMLEEWGHAERPNSYAGYYVDHVAGGVIHVGFTTESAASLVAFVQQANPPAQDRLASYVASSGLSASSLVGKEEAAVAALESSATLRSLVTEIWVDYASNTVKVGANDVSKTSQELQQALGGLNGMTVVLQHARSSYSAGRNRTAGRMLAGDRILIKEEDSFCTAGFGAYEKRNKKSNGNTIIAPFFLTAGHCFARDIEVWRSPYAGFGGKNDWAHLGQVTRSPYEHGAGTIDVEAIRLEAAGVAPRRIYGRNSKRPKFEDPVVGHRGQRLCFSGASTGGVRCGDVVGIRKVQFDEENRPVGCLKIDASNIPGDSGAPVWDPRTGAAVGILRGYVGKFTWVQPLLDTPNNHGDVYRGALEAAQMFDLRLMTGD